MNNANCGGGTCICKPGIAGTNCEIVYRNLYAYSYKGNLRMTGQLDTVRSIDSNLYNYNMIFNAGTDTADYTTMTLEWSDSTGRDVLSMPIVLRNNSNSGSDFTVPAITKDTFTYAGAGSVSSTAASMTLTRTHPHGSTKVVFSFNNFSRQ